MNPLLLNTTLQRVAQTAGGATSNPSLLTAQLLAGAISPSATQAAAEAALQIQAMGDPGWSPEMWNAILLQNMLSIVPLTPSAAPITESQIRDLGPKIWYDGRASRPVSTGGTTLDRLIDLSGNGNHATAAANYPSTSTALCNGRPTIRFDDTKEFVMPAVTTTNLFCVAKIDAVGDGNIIASVGGQYFGLSRTTYEHPWSSGFAAGGASDYGYSKNFGAGSWALYTFQNQSLPNWSSTVPGGVFKMGQNGYEIMYPWASTTFAPTTMGGYSGATYDTVGSVACYIAFDKVLTQAQRDVVSNFLVQTYGLSIPRHKLLFCLGDSIMTATGSVTATQTIPAYLMGGPTAAGELGQEWTGNACAIGGWTAQNLAGQCDSLLSQASSLCSNVALVEIGTNNSAADTAGATADRVADICKLARSRGCRTVLTPMMPKLDGSSETWRSDYNTALANLEAAGVADVFVDPDSEPLLWAAGAQDNAGLFNADKLHLIAAGNHLFAQAVAPAIQQAASMGSL